MIYLLAIVFSALRYGLLPAIISAFLSFALYNYFFVTPFYKFGLGQFSDGLNFALFLCASLASVTLADVYKRKISSLKEREMAARALQDLTKEIGNISDTSETIKSMAMSLREILKSDIVIFLAKEEMVPVFPESWDEDVRSALSCKEEQKTIYDKDWTYYPISTPRRQIGVLGVSINRNFRSERLVEALAYQVGLAIERS